MDPIEKGTYNEKRLLRALRELKDKKHLVISFRRSSPEMDARGIDFLVEILLSGGGKMTVPLEVKSSYFGVKKWKVVHRNLDKAGVLIVYLPLLTRSRRKIRRLVYRALDSVAKNSRNGTLYHSMFQRFFKSRGSKNLRKNVEKIRKARGR